jgi:hypothetical protein
MKYDTKRILGPLKFEVGQFIAHVFGKTRPQQQQATIIIDLILDLGQRYFCLELHFVSFLDLQGFGNLAGPFY